MERASKPRVLVLASGDPEGGGSGFMEVVEFSRTKVPVLNADIVGVVSDHETGGVFQKAIRLDVPFEYFPKPHTAEDYRYFVGKYQADYVMCSGWLPFVRGLDPRRTVNIHPGPLPQFGGKGMWGHHVHEAVIAAFRRGEVTQSAVTMHFVDEVAYDHGPKIFEYPVIIRDADNAEKLGSRVNEKERAWQSHILNLVVHNHVCLMGPPNDWHLVAFRNETGFIPGFTGVYI